MLRKSSDRGHGRQIAGGVYVNTSLGSLAGLEGSGQAFNGKFGLKAVF
jgi:hypothetical protein